MGKEQVTYETQSVYAWYSSSKIYYTLCQKDVKSFLSHLRTFSNDIKKLDVILK